MTFLPPNNGGGPGRQVPLQLLHFNKVTEEIQRGIAYPAKIGNRRIDRAWIYMEIGAPDQDSAAKLAKAYMKHPRARYRGGYVTFAIGVIKDQDGFLDDMAAIFAEVEAAAKTEE